MNELVRTAKTYVQNPISFLTYHTIEYQNKIMSYFPNNISYALTI